MRWFRFEHTDGYCGKYLKQVVVKRRAIHHTPHLLLAIVTLGLWLPRWLRETSAEPEPWRCCECNAEVYKLME